MGWKGALRSINAASRRASRESVRRQKEYDRQQAQLSKSMQREADALEVAEFENYLVILRSVHRDCAEAINWAALASQHEPTAPNPTMDKQRRARQALAEYTPGLLDRFLRREETRRAGLSAEVERAVVLDAAETKKANDRYSAQHAEWTDMRELGRRILAGDREAELEALEQLNPFAELSELGSEISFEVPDRGPIQAEILVNGEDVIPAETKSLLQSGKLSVKKMPVGQFFDIYQDYVCGCVLRTARELFAALPVKAVIVTAKGRVLNSASGHVEVQPILSAVMPRETVQNLNFSALDPSDSMRNFVHRMDFNKTKGFAPVQRIEAPEI